MDYANLIKKYSKYHINISTKVLEEIKEKSNYKEYGARKIDKIIQDGLTNQIIDEILSDKKEITIESLNSKQAV